MWSFELFALLPLRQKQNISLKGRVLLNDDEWNLCWMKDDEHVHNREGRLMHWPVTALQQQKQQFCSRGEEGAAWIAGSHSDVHISRSAVSPALQCT